ncbi:hypothetical protein OG923_03825 [Streptomyces halstedii]|uniref:hypothetical protein n=1 Tax=Streptomyces halstedii TaxID=1944 RepID=UPI0032524178
MINLSATKPACSVCDERTGPTLTSEPVGYLCPAGHSKSGLGKNIGTAAIGEIDHGLDGLRTSALVAPAAASAGKSALASTRPSSLSAAQSSAGGASKAVLI